MNGPRARRRARGCRNLAARGGCRARSDCRCWTRAPSRRTCAIC